MNEMIDMWKKKKMNTFGILYSWFLAKVCADSVVYQYCSKYFSWLLILMLLLAPKVASQLDVLPGAEFRVAFEEAMNYGGKVILGDRPVQVYSKVAEFFFLHLEVY